MKPKYIKERLDGTFVYPDCPNTIKSKEDLQRWFEYTDQISGDNINDRLHLLNHLPKEFIKDQTDTEIKILFPRCRFLATATFTGNECYKISL